MRYICGKIARVLHWGSRFQQGQIRDSQSHVLISLLILSILGFSQNEEVLSIFPYLARDTESGTGIAMAAIWQAQNLGETEAGRDLSVGVEGHSILGTRH